jgi:hypothetical protein
MLTEAPFSFKGLVMSRKVRPHIACYVPAATGVRLSHISIARHCERRRCVRTLTNRTSTQEIFPRLDAIQNVFALALKRDPEIKHFNPLALWDLHYLREIDDSGYIGWLYR